MAKKSYKLYDLLKKYVLITVVVVTLFSASGFGWLSYLAMQNDRSLLSNQINTALARILTPSLDISDTCCRLSKSGEAISAVDAVLRRRIFGVSVIPPYFS